MKIEEKIIQRLSDGRERAEIRFIPETEQDKLSLNNKDNVQNTLMFDYGALRIESNNGNTYIIIKVADHLGI